MLRMPTAVLMMIGQIAVMKMTKIADGWPSRNAASDSGSQERRHRAQHLEDRIEPAHRPDRLPDQGAERDAGHRGERIAKGDALQARRQVPEQPLVDATAVEERIG